MAFATLIEHHSDNIFSLSYRLTRIPADAEDLTQDTYTTLPAKLANFRGEPHCTTWLW